MIFGTIFMVKLLCVNLLDIHFGKVRTLPNLLPIGQRMSTMNAKNVPKIVLNAVPKAYTFRYFAIST